MGLLDFFSNGGNTNPQGTNVNPPTVPDFASIQQSYTNQSLANVSYPMASSNPYAPVPQAAPQPVVPQSNVVQPQQYPSMPGAPVPMAQSVMPVNQAMPVTMPQPLPVMPSMPIEPAPMPVQSAPEPSKPEEQDIPSYEYVDPSKHPLMPEVNPDKGHTETMPEGIKVTTFENGTQPLAEQPATEQPVMEQSAPVAEPSVMSQPMPTETPVTEPQVIPEPVQEMPVMPPQPEVMPELSMPNLTEQTVAPEMTPVEQPVQMPEVIPTPELTPAPVVEETKPAVETSTFDTMEFGTNAEPTPETPEVVEQPAEVPVVEQVESVPETSIPEINPMEATDSLNGIPEQGLPATPLAEAALQDQLNAVAEAVPEVQTAEPVAEVVAETPVAETVEMPVLDTPEVQPVEVVAPQAEAKVEEAPVAQPAVPFEMSYFKTVAFIGLNSSQPNLKVVEKVAELSKQLASHSEVFIIDSAKGYAKSIFDSAKEANIELTGMYLKPFHSNYSDEADLGEYENYTLMMFSNSADKIKSILKESDMLIMPEVNGVNNLGTLFEIWSTNSMYPGQNKPLILIGKGWTNILSQLKNLFKLSDSDLAFVTVCSTTEEALAKIAQFDKDYITREVKQPKKVIDLREEDDEDGLFI